jgi:Flp pilus assembly protein TadD
MGVWDWKVIEKEANAVLSKKQDDVNASRRRAHAVGMQGNVNQGIELMGQHLYYNGKDAKAHDILAGFLIMAGRAQEALAASDKALAADPKYKEARYNRAVACVKLGKAEEGIRDLTVAVEANGEFREIAAEDADFAPIAANPRFKTAIAPPPPKKDK